MDVKSYVVAIKAVPDEEAKSASGEFEAILSAPTEDRDGEVVDAKAFDPLPDHIPIDVDHGMSVMSTVASGQPYYDGDLLRFRGTYASTELAQDVRTLVREGHIRKMSVAFMNPQREVKDGVPHVVKAELLNAAIVAIPSNREAEITAAKRLALKVGARNSADDASRLQQIHDLAVTNGAECKAPESEGDKAAGGNPVLKTYKTVAGSREHQAELLRSALRTQHPDSWVRVLATFEDTLIYELDGWDESSAGQYQATYSIAEDGAVTLGSPEAVSITETVSPAKTPDADPEGKAAAPAAAAPPADVASMLARLRVDAAEAELALLDL